MEAEKYKQERDEGRERDRGQNYGLSPERQRWREVMTETWSLRLRSAFRCWSRGATAGVGGGWKGEWPEG